MLYNLTVYTTCWSYISRNFLHTCINTCWRRCAVLKEHHTLSLKLQHTNSVTARSSLSPSNHRSCCFHRFKSLYFRHSFQSVMRSPPQYSSSNGNMYEAKPLQELLQLFQAAHHLLCMLQFVRSVTFPNANFKLLPYYYCWTEPEIVWWEPTNIRSFFRQLHTIGNEVCTVFLTRRMLLFKRPSPRVIRCLIHAAVSLFLDANVGTYIVVFNGKIRCPLRQSLSTRT
jgi:hypothetical protein